MKRFNFKQKLSKRKSIYTMAAVSLLLSAVAITAVYSRTMNSLEKNLTQISTTKSVHQNQTGVSDPRVASTLQSTTALTEAATEAQPEPDFSAEEEISEAQTMEAAATTAPSTALQQSFIRPHDGEIIKAYSPDVPLYSETMRDWRTHNGIDIAINEGDEVLSIGKGTVSKVLVDSAFGYTVEVDYGTLTARYCGMKQGECVSIGQSLEKGDSIGVVEAVPCEAESSPHLHFEIIVDGEEKDPAKACNW